MLFMTITMYVLVVVAAIIIIPAFIITILDVILDVGLNPFIHLDLLHTLLVFPIMLGFIHLRFYIQKRNEFTYTVRNGFGNSWKEKEFGFWIKW